MSRSLALSTVVPPIYRLSPMRFQIYSLPSTHGTPAFGGRLCFWFSTIAMTFGEKNISFCQNENSLQLTEWTVYDAGC